MFENVTYDYYSDTLGRSLIESEEVFNSYKLEAVQYVKSIERFLIEREENGIDSATCLIIEELYKASKDKTENGAVISSFSLDGYSQNMDISSAMDVKEKVYKWIKLYCYVDSGVSL